MLADSVRPLPSAVDRAGGYAGLARHIYFHVSAPGHRDMITQWQIADRVDPEPEIRFDFALQPA